MAGDCLAWLFSKRGWIESGATKPKSIWWQGAAFEPETSGIIIQSPNCLRSKRSLPRTSRTKYRAGRRTRGKWGYNKKRPIFRASQMRKLLAIFRSAGTGALATQARALITGPHRMWFILINLSDNVPTLNRPWICTDCCQLTYWFLPNFEFQLI